MAIGGRISFNSRAARRLVERAIGSLRDELPGAVERVLQDAEAKMVEITPVDTGFLEASTVVEVEERSGSVDGTVRFSAGYAAEVHELPAEARGPRTRRKPGNEFGGAGPKYVERVLRGFPWNRRLGEEMSEALNRAASDARRGR